MKRASLVLSAIAFALTTSIINLPTTQAAGGANSRSALNQVVHELDVDGASLQKVVDYLHNVTGANIVVDWKTLEQAGVDKQAAVSLRVREVTLRKMLQLVLNQASPNSPLTYGIDNNVIEVTTQEALDKNMITKVYIVDDLVMVGQTVPAPTINLTSLTQNSGGGGGGSGGFGGGSSGGGGGSGGTGFFNQNQTTQNTQTSKQASDQKGQELVDLIKSVIRPAIWSDNGGTASIRYFNGKLIVTAPVSVHEAIGGPVGDTGIRYGY